MPSGQLNEPETNGLASVAENSSRGVIFEIEELQDEKVMVGCRTSVFFPNIFRSMTT